ncbi:LacI family DNA-binding transcriptional regulator [Novosphingobium pituita]|jgi:DNA-binding LacI/PurR family transcriptional regulator|uniref:LacI family DNA-binding transcriptional regulator n=1 Tax=Novosphingobium pituita TaxID=3056842 RepID=A0ABQ6P497_9SPHN|nr:LacI family DNA-binding transcriptional regulator [Novosphingobium sp. IK01]MDK4806311.1 LacI family DNA-binding transcriptional regulator [Novosphingobium aromaticivorans]GMM60073.1 LacI family DNA-binding transcriptional regulator [Novosphingobium sp. IK01]
MTDTAADKSTREGNKPRIRNIAELARMAGVSAGTVSRALAGKSLVNAETRERIQTIAREHGFRPNQMARRLRTQRTGVIGVVIPLGHERRQHISDPFFMTLFGHLADALTESGHDLMLSRVIPGDDEWLDRIVDSGMLDGALVIGQSNQMEAIERVAERYRPLVVWGSHRPGQIHCTVGTDNREGGRLAAQRLMDQGMHHLAFFGDTGAPEIADRLHGARDAVTKGGGSYRIAAFPTHLSNDEIPEQVAAHLEKMGSGFDGIVCASDVIAMTTLRLLHERGVRVPVDIAVTGFDDVPLATQTVPRLTTIRQDIASGARAMVDLLMQRIAGVDTPSCVMPPELVIRESA